MTRQPEQILEENLITQLAGMRYQRVTINDEADLLVNLKEQLEKHNGVQLTDKEFAQVLNHLDKGNVFEKAKILRDKMQLTKEDGDSVYLEFINMDQWCKNTFQVTNQVTVEGSYKNRYDVTILINGLPLVQIELKRRGLELKEAFNQINRYQKHSYWAGHALFQYVQVFVISNGENTKYYANNKRQTFKQTFYWSDVNNKRISQLSKFVEEFLEPCHLAKMITRYVVMNEAYKILMVLRPYQYFATEALIDRVKNSTNNAYVWHTTGSGKTLTSFKASQVIMNLPQVDKVVFVVDRKDLDYQTSKEFNAFSKGSVDSTDNTKKLVEQFTDGTQLIVTTIQKLNNAISKKNYLYRMEKMKDKRIIFIFDECHRSQFGDTHQKIVKFFTNHQLFGFTGTPIFAENAYSKNSVKHTTKELFGECIHKYVITDAIKDENVLKFSVEYIGRYREKQSGDTLADIEVEGIDIKELMDSEQRLEKITDYILSLHNRKTHSRTFTGMFCVSSIDTLIRYYELFKQRKNDGKHNLKIATVFSYGVNEDDKDATGLYEEELPIAAEGFQKYNKHSREKLDEYIGDYNQMFGMNFSTRDTQSFYNYYNDISKRVKAQQIDILLVVNMFLTGFDSPTLNTLYVDKNLKYHGLIQAYSRTNRILTEQKSQGNIVCFRNLKNATDDAIALFSNKDAKEVILLQPYEEYVRKFNIAFAELLKIAPTTASVDELPSEDEELEFIKAFRELMRLKNVLSSFVEFSFDDLAMNEQTFENYKSKYLDLWQKVKSDTSKEKDSILDDVDFELELIHRDEINVAYILKLLAQMKDASKADQERQKKQILEHLTGEAKLRSKKELIEKFIQENLPHIEDADDIPEAFEVFWKNEQKIAFDTICREEHLVPVKLQDVIENYLYTERKPLREDIVGTLETKPKIRDRKTIIERVTSRIYGFVDTFVSGMAG
ncbi:type I restriction endonuclease subunit R [uncultured Draconibacterium sp.]|uniref:type I restriction endonuclease subunit R n=1 Tax=uncultured Draconibacterium sp. TaxID=1573823 RepID=UPI0025F1FF1F|nr:type I restriction endonuclease subunit R [uncultured Draconibacterium sp.]